MAGEWGAPREDRGGAGRGRHVGRAPPPRRDRSVSVGAEGNGEGRATERAADGARGGGGFPCAAAGAGLGPGFGALLPRPARGNWARAIFSGACLSGGAVRVRRRAWVLVLGANRVLGWGAG
jgi:hypothetical protein